ncbi:MAG: C10 family peptidase [Fluviicola sp.]
MKLLLAAFIWVVSFMGISQVAPFLTTTWNQTCYYNDSCPTVGSGGSCGKAYTGCNSTAIGQIFKYYNYPSETFGGNYCNDVNPSYCVDFDVQTYNYALMPNNVTSANPEVAKMLYQIGVAVDMQWSGTSSNSFFAPNAMKRFFGYSPRMNSSANFLFATLAERIAAMKAELDAGRPILAKGGSHFYLIDGYNSSDQFHMNFGWSGTYNGYYDITSVTNPAGTFTPTNYIFGIEPMSGDLQTAVDTLEVPAYASTNTSIEFSSKLTWTMNSTQSWLTLNTTSGTKGYFTWQDGSSFNTVLNNGAVRYATIYVSNANDTDTIVVKQLASPLQTDPDTMNVIAAGESASVNVSYLTGSSWSAAATESWISATPASGTGNGSVNVTIAENTTTSPRSGFVVITAGMFTDSVLVQQDGAISTAGLVDNDQKQALKIHPNPGSDWVVVESPAAEGTMSIVNLLGAECYSVSALEKQLIDISDLEPGVYFVVVGNLRSKFVKE